MVTRRRTRAFWERLVADAADGSVAETARRHRVRAGTLRWWKWQLGKDATRAGSRRELAPKLLPVVLAAGNLAQHSVVVEVADVTMRIETGTDPHYVAALASALRSTC